MGVLLTRFKQVVVVKAYVQVGVNVGGIVDNVIQIVIVLKIDLVAKEINVQQKKEFVESHLFVDIMELKNGKKDLWVFGTQINVDVNMNADNDYIHIFFNKLMDNQIKFKKCLIY